ncbi:MAG: beta-ketoacyl-[acyl-carrier-protein] synthase family protein [Spirochaetia bacterium]|nr:beta-ketoacyl-[acyl-carrier-protein] synthase family protein [Spirochaetia bacterium]
MKNNNSNIVITGMSLASPIGNNQNEFYNAIKNQHTATAELKGMDVNIFTKSIGAEVKKEIWNENLTDRDDRKKYFLDYTLEQLFKSSCEIEKYNEASRILSLGTGLDYINVPDLVENISDGDKIIKLDDYYHSTYDVAMQAALKYNIHGGISVNLATCVASSQAIGIGYRFLKKTENKIFITGGFDSMLNYSQYLGFQRLGTFSTWDGDPACACRPFDKKRSGLVLGEGAALFTLQRADEADQKSILAEIKGYGSTMDGYLVTDPEPSGLYLAKAAISAIKDAGLSPDDIDSVHLHGTGTFKNDPAEANAMKIIFGDRYKKIPVFSLKGSIGHGIGACSALEVCGVIYALENQVTPVTVNYEFPDDTVGLFAIKGEEHKMKINNILKLNANIGGQNSALVIGRHGQ